MSTITFAGPSVKQLKSKNPQKKVLGSTIYLKTQVQVTEGGEKRTLTFWIPEEVKQLLAREITIDSRPREVSWVLVDTHNVYQKRYGGTVGWTPNPKGPSVKDEITVPKTMLY